MDDYGQGNYYPDGLYDDYATPIPAPPDNAPRHIAAQYRKLNTAAELRLHYRDSKWRLDHITVCEFDGDAEDKRVLRIVEGRDNESMQDYLEAPSDGKPYSYDVDWDAMPDGSTLRITYPDVFGPFGWTVGAFLDVDHMDGRLDRDALHNLSMMMFGSTTYEYPDDEGKKRPMLEAKLTAHLQAHAGEFETPYHAELCARAFLKSLEAEVVCMNREKYAPLMFVLLYEAREKAKTISTGIDSLDDALHGGFARGGVYIVAGDPSAGKTALAVQCLLYAAHECAEDERAVYVMLDQGGRGEIAKRMASLSHAISRSTESAGRVDGCELSRANRWDGEEVDGAIKAYSAITRERAVLMDSTAAYDGIMDDIRHMTTEADVTIRLLVVDYYQLIQSGGKYEETVTVASDPTFASHVISELRTWANSYRVPVLLVGQFTKEAIERHAKGAEARMTDLLGSVDVPYQAEAVLCLTNSHDGSGIVTLADTKHRHAGNDAQKDRAFRLLLDGEHGLFSEAV